MREIVTAEARGDDAARLAIEVFVHRIVLTVGAYFTLLAKAVERLYSAAASARIRRGYARVSRPACVRGTWTSIPD